jgi:hypothetical protein
VLDLSIAVIDDLNLQREEKIKDISKIVIDAVNYVTENMKEDVDRVAAAYKYALVLCSDFRITLTPERENIIKQLIELSFSKVK